MATIAERKRVSGKKSFTAQVRIKKDGKHRRFSAAKSSLESLSPRAEELLVGKRRFSMHPRTLLKPQIDLVLYDMADQSEEEQAWYLQFIQDKLKLYKAMFRNYSSMIPRSQHLTLAARGAKARRISTEIIG